MLKQSQLQSMKVSLERGGTTTAAIQRVGTQLTTNNVESGIGGLRSVAGHQAEQADAMLPIEAMKIFCEHSYRCQSPVRALHASRRSVGVVLRSRGRAVEEYFKAIIIVRTGQSKMDTGDSQARC